MNNIRVKVLSIGLLSGSFFNTQYIGANACIPLTTSTGYDEMTKKENTDASTDIQQLKDLMAQFMRERDWNKFNSPKNVSVRLAIEAAELMEKFVRINEQESYDEYVRNRQEVEDEIADVFMNVLTFCNVTGIDLSNVMRRKFEQTAKKYPVELAKGNGTKYTKLQKT